MIAELAVGALLQTIQPPAMTTSEAISAWTHCLFEHASGGIDQPDTSEQIARGALAACYRFQSSLEYAYFYPLILRFGPDEARRRGREYIADAANRQRDGLMAFIQTERSARRR